MADVKKIGQGVSSGGALVGAGVSAFNPAIGMGIIAGSQALGAGLQLFAGDEGVQGPTAGQRVAAIAARRKADQLASGQGLSDTQVSRMREGTETAVSQMFAQVVDLARNTQMSSIAINRLAKEAARNARTQTAQTEREILIADIESKQADLRSSLQAESISGQREDAIAQGEIFADEKERQLRQQKEANYAKIIGMSTQAVTAVAGLAGSPDVAATPQSETPSLELQNQDLVPELQDAQLGAGSLNVNPVLASEAATASGMVYDPVTGTYKLPEELRFTSDFLGA